MSGNEVAGIFIVINLSMKRYSKILSFRQLVLICLVSLNIAVLLVALIANASWYWWLLFTAPMLMIAIKDSIQTRHAIIRNFPVLGHLRYFFESVRPELRQYFFESDLDGKPFNRRQRSLVYQRAKNVKQTVPFGMQSNSQEIGY